MESGAKGCEVVVSGKLRAARAKSMKFTVSGPSSPNSRAHDKGNWKETCDVDADDGIGRIHDPFRSASQGLH